MPKLTKQQFNDLLADQQIVNDINQSLGQYGINIDIGVARDAENDDSPLKNLFLQ
ncbi:MAG: hypothetical protein HWD59_11945 [Coxiellaceae bacterium]|nr:MAG: hypothetical protein HWD59_11945 [Coxiellaceae bacterium]